MAAGFTEKAQPNTSLWRSVPNLPAGRSKGWPSSLIQTWVIQTHGLLHKKWSNQQKKRTRTDSLCSWPAALNGQGRHSKTPQNPWGCFFLSLKKRPCKQSARTGQRTSWQRWLHSLGPLWQAWLCLCLLFVTGCSSQFTHWFKTSPAAFLALQHPNIEWYLW